MRGGRASFIAEASTPCTASCCAAHGEAVLGVLVATWRSYLPRGPSSESSSIFVRIPTKRGKPPANRELRLAAGVAVFLTQPGSQIKSQRAERNPCAKAVVWAEKRIKFSVPCDTLFLKVLDLRETELGLKRYGLANRGHQSVFGSPQGNFPIEIPARLEKILAIQELHTVSEHVLFLKVMGSRITFQGELRFARCGPANRGYRSVSHTGGSFSDRDSSLTGGALDDPRVAHCS
uniref:Uncharacterized protein n=1 Tax=Fagus sylvatica TaxID=28930 RepID=A0A2N9FKG9_FAGSY